MPGAGHNIRGDEPPETATSTPSPTSSPTNSATTLEHQP